MAVGPAVNTVTGEFIAICTLGSVLILQWVMSRLEMSVSEHRHVNEMLRVMYKELTILGIVAFVLFTIESFGGDIADDMKHQFEVIHITLFIIAVFYAALVIALVIFSIAIARSWMKTEIKYSHFKDWKKLKIEYRHLKAKLYLRKSQQNISKFVRFRKRCSNPCTMLRYSKLLNISRFLEQKLRLIMRYNLPRTFAYTFYLRKCKQHVFYELVEIPYSLWAVFAWAISLDLYLRSVSEGYKEAVTPEVLVISGSCVVLIGCMVLYIKIRKVYWSVVHSDSVRAQVDDKQLEESRSWDDFFRRMRAKLEIKRRHSAQRTNSERKQKRLFWFNRPALLIRIMQVLCS